MKHAHLTPILLMIGPPKIVLMKLIAYDNEFARFASHGVVRPPPPRLLIASDMAGPTSESLYHVQHTDSSLGEDYLRSKQHHLEQHTPI
jgi:hypothetical protein